MIVRLILVLSIAGAIRAAREVCYDRLGCFTDCPPYSKTPERPISRLPWAPEVINTKFLLFTQENPDQYQVIRALNVTTVFGTNFKARRNSVFIIHGFLETGDKQWLVDMCQTLLKVSDVNCFCVDWTGGSFALYTQACNNIRVVGAEIAHFLHFLQAGYDYHMSNVYLIGHSLGAHVAGEAGKRQGGIGRISGLDTAGPYFENTPPSVRLDPSDALFVDAIHTDGPIDAIHLGFGMKQTVGNVDFFPNGGKQMPGCGKISIRLEDIDELLEGVYEAMFCNHQMSVKYFMKSILRPDGFVGYPASTYKAFQKGSGFPCTNGSCDLMGYKADEYESNHGQDSTISQMFFLNTGDPSNFLRWRYKISISVFGSEFLLGSLSVSLCGKVGCSNHSIIYSGLLHSGATYSSFIDVGMDVNPVQEVEFVWHKSVSFLPAKLGASVITIQYGPTGETNEFCGGDLTEENTNQILDKCSSSLPLTL